MPSNQKATAALQGKIQSLLARGNSKRSVARTLGISDSTVRKYCSVETPAISPKILDRLKSGLEADKPRIVTQAPVVLRDLIKSSLVGSIWDIHYPEIDAPTVSCHLDWLTRNQVNGYVLGGDGLNNRMLSPHTEGVPDERTEEYFDMVEKFDKDFLTPVENLLGSAWRIYIRGNHEDWESQFVAKNPNLRGMESHLQLKLKERGWKIIDCGKIFTHGKLNFFHGEWLSGQNHAKMAVEKLCGNGVYGHFHTMQQYTKVLAYNRKQKWQSQCMPIAGRVNAAWIRNAPNSWINGMGVHEFHSSGNFNTLPLVISEGICSYGGNIYGK